MSKQVHTSHPDILKRLKRADGHLHTVMRMMEEKQPCLKIAQQLQAVEKAIANAKATLIHDHIDNCLRSPSKGKHDDLKDLKQISKFL